VPKVDPLYPPLSDKRLKKKFAQFGLSWANFCSLLDSIKPQISVSEICGVVLEIRVIF
jgi:hypothetical protein